MSGQLADRRNIGDLLGVREKGEVLWNLPDEHLSIFRCRCNDTIVEGVPVEYVSGSCRSIGEGGRGVPVSVEDGGSVSAKQRDLVRSLAPLLQRNHSKGATTGSIPID